MAWHGAVPQNVSSYQKAREYAFCFGAWICHVQQCFTEKRRLLIGYLMLQSVGAWFEISEGFERKVLLVLPDGIG